MTRRNTLYVKLSDSSNLTGDANDKANSLHKLLLVKIQVSNAFANASTANIKFSKTQVSEMVQLGGFFSKLLKPLTTQVCL